MSGEQITLEEAIEHYRQMVKRAKRGTSNSNSRGNTTQRKARRAWLLEVYAADVPGSCRCYRCGVLLTESTVTVDRIVPGCKGGKYERTNIRPACGPCNSLTGATTRRDS
jgi:5-methylcytosine-specific restriction endonuclease McrA